MLKKMLLKGKHRSKKAVFVFFGAFLAQENQTKQRSQKQPLPLPARRRRRSWKHTSLAVTWKASTAGSWSSKRSMSTCWRTPFALVLLLCPQKPRVCVHKQHLLVQTLRALLLLPLCHRYLGQRNSDSLGGFEPLHFQETVDWEATPDN